MRPTLRTATVMVPAMIQEEGQHRVGVTMVSMELNVPAKKVSKYKSYHNFMKDIMLYLSVFDIISTNRCIDK